MEAPAGAGPPPSRPSRALLEAVAAGDVQLVAALARSSQEMLNARLTGEELFNGRDCTPLELAVAAT